MKVVAIEAARRERVPVSRRSQASRLCFPLVSAPSQPREKGPKAHILSQPACIHERDEIDIYILLTLWNRGSLSSSCTGTEQVPMHCNL